jgi:hypothetical protein
MGFRARQLCSGGWMAHIVFFFVVQNSNLVLQADRTLIERRGRDEATGEVVTLNGKLEGQRMGDRFLREKYADVCLAVFFFSSSSSLREILFLCIVTVDKQARSAYLSLAAHVHFSKLICLFACRPAELAEQRAKRQRKEEKAHVQKKLYVVSASTMSSQYLQMGLRYRPTTKDTQRVYELLLNYITGCLGSQPQDVLCGAADEILEVLKDDKFKVRAVVPGINRNPKDWDNIVAVAVCAYHFLAPLTGLLTRSCSPRRSRRRWSSCWASWTTPSSHSSCAWARTSPTTARTR